MVCSNTSRPASVTTLTIVPRFQLSKRVIQLVFGHCPSHPYSLSQRDIPQTAGYITSIPANPGAHTASLSPPPSPPSPIRPCSILRCSCHVPHGCAARYVNFYPSITATHAALLPSPFHTSIYGITVRGRSVPLRPFLCTSLARRSPLRRHVERWHVMRSAIIDPHLRVFRLI